MVPLDINRGIQGVDYVKRHNVYIQRTMYEIIRLVGVLPENTYKAKYIVWHTLDTNLRNVHVRGIISKYRDSSICYAHTGYTGYG